MTPTVKKPARHTAVERIAERLNRDIRAGAVTPEQIALVISGVDSNPSHPVHQKIITEAKRIGLL